MIFGCTSQALKCCSALGPSLSSLKTINQKICNLRSKNPYFAVFAFFSNIPTYRQHLVAHKVVLNDLQSIYLSTTCVCCDFFWIGYIEKTKNIQFAVFFFLFFFSSFSIYPSNKQIQLVLCSGNTRIFS